MNWGDSVQPKRLKYTKQNDKNIYLVMIRLLTAMKYFRNIYENKHNTKMHNYTKIVSMDFCKSSRWGVYVSSTVVGIHESCKITLHRIYMSMQLRSTVKFGELKKLNSNSSEQGAARL